MMAELLYYASPKLIQEALIYIKSASMKYRYSLPSSDSIIQIPNSLAAEKESATTYESEFNNYLLEACKNVPYYRSIINGQGLNYRDISFDNYKEYLPILTKEDIRRNPASFLNQSKLRKPISIRTSGTTGTPLTIVTNGACRTHNYRFFNALLLMLGTHPFDRSVTIGGKVLHRNQNTTDIGRLDRYSNNLYLSNYHLSFTNALRYIETIESYDPVFIEAYPHAITTLAKRLKFEGRKYKALSLRGIITSSENIPSDDRAQVEKEFCCPLVNQYGNAEMSIFGYSLGDRMSYPGRYSQSEFIKNDNEVYEIVSTSIVNYVMPLIRYKTGDTVSKVYKNSIFGAETSLVEGRTEDFLLLPDGRKITQFNPVSNINNVIQAQIIQESPYAINILLLPTEHFTNKDKLLLIENCNLKLGDDVVVKITETDQFKLSKSGKFTFIIREFS